tara:strand:- start:4236 stop:5063 length:828 start_codon:yes stop_codon:yes gene_type:complete
MNHLLGIDFEDWYHPKLIKENIKDKQLEPTVIKGLDKILEFLRKHETYATFFVVGELLEYDPSILDKILENGHEIGFHTMHHNELTSMTKETFLNELEKFSHLTKNKSKGFRAPTFSLNSSTFWAIEALIKHNYTYDSSVIPAKSTMYGNPNAKSYPYKISKNSLDDEDSKGKIMEFPILVTKFLGKKIPAGGGFYLRTLPMRIIKNGINDYQKNEIPATFYIHSWELTPEYMPKLDLPTKENFITFHNVNKATEKMGSILQDYNFTSFERFMRN